MYLWAYARIALLLTTFMRHIKIRFEINIKDIGMGNFISV